MPEATLQLSSAETVPVGPLPCSPLSPGATGALRCWLQAQRGALVGDGEVRRALRAVCADARGRGVGLERVVVLLRRLWATLPPVSAGDAWRDAGRERLDAIVRLCAEEFAAVERRAAGKIA